MFAEGGGGGEVGRFVCFSKITIPCENLYAPIGY